MARARRNPADQWHSPPGGYPGRHPDEALILDAEFATDPDLERLAPWRLFAAIEALLGRHRVEGFIFGNHPELSDTDDDIKDMGAWNKLLATTERLGIPDGWLTLAPAWAALCSLKASRGGGALRHTAWLWERQPVHLYPTGNVRLEIKTRHIPAGRRAELEAVITAFFQCAYDAGCFYGRGDVMIPKSEDQSPRPFADGFTETMWQNADGRTKPIVPGVYLINFFTRDRLARLGGPDLLRNFKTPFTPHRKWTRCIEIGDAVLFVTDPWDLASDNREQRERGGLSSDPACWLLGMCSRANMLAVQHTDWMEKEVERAKEYYAEEALRKAEEKRAKHRPAKSLRRWLDELRTRPPRFLRDASASPARGPNPVPGGHASVTQFEIGGTALGGGGEALTLYGRAVRGAGTLGSPIRAGSMQQERAVFTFSLARDGYDGEYGHNGRELLARLSQFKCPRCDGRLFFLRAVLEYPEDLGELSADEQKRAEDFFTWFWLHARCAACQWEGLAADVECA